MTQYYNRKEFNKKRLSNRVTNGLCNAMGLPTDPMGNVKDPNVLSKIFQGDVNSLITWHWLALTNAYNKNAFLQTAVNQKVEDAFRNDGLIIDSKTLSTEELEELRQTMEEEGDITAIMDCIRWGRLYGGGCLVAQTEQDPELPIDEKQLKGKKLKFLATNRWQCTPLGISPYVAEKFAFTDTMHEGEVKRDNVNNYQDVDRSRVAIFTGTNAPYLTRQLMQGWNTSIFEGILEPIENLLGGFNVTLELLSEAKIDIFKIADLATTLISPDGERKIRQRLSIATANKNYKGSLAMDSNDDYQQKQINFGGIPQLIEQLMYIFCGYLRYPVSKLFGVGSSGFSSGEDDIENYNGTVDSEVRIPARQLISWVVKLRCWQLFGRELPDFRPKWRPLRVMSEKEQAEINSRRLADYIVLLEHQVMTPKQVAQKLTEDTYILFSDEEINKVSDEFQEDMASSVREDIEM